MAGATAKYAFPYPTGGDDVAAGDEKIKALAERIDLMIGQSGDVNLAPSGSDVVTSQAVAYGRAYPTVPKVICGIGSPVGSGATVFVWPTLETVNGFTINMRASNASARTVTWTARP